MAENRYVIEPLSAQHNRAAFRSTSREITHYFRRYALANSEARIAAAWVLLDTSEQRIIGFYTLSSASIALTSLPAAFAEQLPRYPVPVALLGRMGVDRQYERRGFGRQLVVDALLRVYQQNVLAVYAMIVDPKDDAREFYTRNFGFLPLADDHTRLFLPLQTFMQTLSASDAPPDPDTAAH